ncbi:hypothetical protein J8F10_38105 [Gemmata sp. G18]|uniref:Uncharacterized protein n=1 Tax=Gemmata palustris TaxID=2822762 RepID=A0ABS5C506_9BACT|nr:hypothetical protein [Gemmata palustris]MBP3961071.1 hypothetical protein [Gemmata palustris]
MDGPALPDESNVFGSLHTSRSPEFVARAFARSGWDVRKCSWTDYEITCEFAELVIERSAVEPEYVLIHGSVADVRANLPRVTEPLAAAGIPYSLECYNAERDLIHHARG